MAFPESNLQVGWLLQDFSERGEQVEAVSAIAFNAIYRTLRTQDRILDIVTGRRLGRIIQPPREETMWALLQAAPNTPPVDVAQLRSDVAEAYRPVFHPDSPNIPGLDLPKDLTKERYLIGCLTVPQAARIIPSELWVPDEFRP